MGGGGGSWGGGGRGAKLIVAASQLEPQLKGGQNQVDLWWGGQEARTMTTTLIGLLLLLAGDVEQNPGPPKGREPKPDPKKIMEDKVNSHDEKLGKAATWSWKIFFINRMSSFFNSVVVHLQTKTATVQQNTEQFTSQTNILFGSYYKCTNLKIVGNYFVKTPSVKNF